MDALLNKERNSLLALNGRYARLARLQVLEEELEVL